MDRNPKRDLPGVSYAEGCRYTDQYTGTKESLIAAGIAEAEWFPCELVKVFRKDGAPWMKGGKQRTQRTYWVKGVTPETSVTQRLNADGLEVWIVNIANAERLAEAQKRHEEWERDYEARNAPVKADPIEEQRQETAKQARIAAAINALPPFTPGSMSEGEKHLMRVMRGLHGIHFDYIADMAERLLDRKGELVEVVAGGEEQTIPPKNSTPTKPNLRLVK